MNSLTRFTCFAALLSLASAVGRASAADGPLADGDFKIEPPYADAPELTVKDGVPKGSLHEFTMDSQDSKIYPGLKGAYKRKVAVYIPNGYAAGTAAPFIVIQDGMTKDSLPKILDNMINDHRLPPMIAVFISSGGGDGKGSERGLEYDTVSETYAVFIETEVLPRIEKDYKVTFTKDPEGRATMGGSSGAACRLHDGLVPPGPVPPRAELLGDLRRSAIADEPQVAARRLGVPREPHPQERGQAAAGLAGGGREGQRTTTRMRSRITTG